MDGRGPLDDNVFIERLWRSLKHEDVYLKGYSDGHILEHEAVNLDIARMGDKNALIVRNGSGPVEHHGSAYSLQR
jgi:hypothetical protein